MTAIGYLAYFGTITILIRLRSNTGIDTSHWQLLVTYIHNVIHSLHLQNGQLITQSHYLYNIG